MADEPGTQQGGSGSGGSEPPARRRPRKARDEVVAHFVTKFGSPEDAVAELADENLDYREKNAALTESLRTRALPDGHVAVPKAQADLLPAYTALGTPDAVKAAVAQATTLATTLAEREQADALGDVAEGLGMKRAALVKLGKRERFALAEVKEEEQDGKKTKVLYVRPLGEPTAAPVPLETFATARDFADFLPALVAPADGGGSSAPPARTGGGSYPAQASTGGAPAGRTREQLEAAARAEMAGLL